jgi:hypothetical protein
MLNQASSQMCLNVLSLSFYVLHPPFTVLYIAFYYIYELSKVKT